MQRTYTFSRDISGAFVEANEATIHDVNLEDFMNSVGSVHDFDHCVAVSNFCPFIVFYTPAGPVAYLDPELECGFIAEA
jgi:hypothetical protein